MQKLMLASTIGLLMIASPASAGCYVGSFKFFAGSETDANMTVSSGQT